MRLAGSLDRRCVYMYVDIYPYEILALRQCRTGKELDSLPMKIISEFVLALQTFLNKGSQGRCHHGHLVVDKLWQEPKKAATTSSVVFKV